MIQRVIFIRKSCDHLDFEHSNIVSDLDIRISDFKGCVW